jgi:hypothetical protein
LLVAADFVVVEEPVLPQPTAAAANANARARARIVFIAFS